MNTLALRLRGGKVKAKASELKKSWKKEGIRDQRGIRTLGLLRVAGRKLGCKKGGVELLGVRKK